MVRNLYRLYLYAVCTILLITATITTGVSLGLLLLYTPLRGTGSPPGRVQAIQAVVALVSVWLVTILLGGLHYWLIRRDMATDPAAGGGTVRSFALNLTQLFAVLIAAGEAASGISTMGQPYNSPTASFAATLSLGGLFALLQWERGRTRVSTRGAVALQRLHLYGAQLVLVFIATPFWIRAVQSTVLYVATRTGAFNPCASSYDPLAGCVPETYYPLRQVVAQWGAALFVAACWAGYTALSRNDRHSRLRQVTHLVGFGYGLGFALWGAQGVLAALLRQAIGHSFPLLDFASGTTQVAGALAFGIVAVLAYHWLYRREAADLPSGMPAAKLIQWALAGAIFAYPFWIGTMTLVIRVIESVVPAGTRSSAEDFTRASAIVLSGLPFVYLAIRLARQTRATNVTWPHRAFVLVMLAGGVVASATGLVICLQSLGSTLLGAPPDNWQYTVRSGLVTLLLGGVMVAIFATLALRNRYLAGHPAAAKPLLSGLDTSDTHLVAVPDAATMVVPTESLEGILDALLAGRLTRDEAAARIRAGG